MAANPRRGGWYHIGTADVTVTAFSDHWVDCANLVTGTTTSIAWADWKAGADRFTDEESATLYNDMVTAAVSAVPVPAYIRDEDHGVPEYLRSRFRKHVRELQQSNRTAENERKRKERAERIILDPVALALGRLMNANVSSEVMDGKVVIMFEGYALVAVGAVGMPTYRMLPIGDDGLPCYNSTIKWYEDPDEFVERVADYVAKKLAYNALKKGAGNDC